MQSRVLGWPLAVKRLVVVALDVVLALLATWAAFALRLDGFYWPTGAQWVMFALTPVLAIPIFIKFGLYRAIFRYSGQAALHATGMAVLIYACLLSALVLWMRWPGVPRSMGLLQPLVFLFLVGSSRAVARFWLADLRSAQARVEGNLLIYGAGTSGVQTAEALRLSQQYALIGFLDDDDSKVGRSINGVPVFAASEVRQVVAARGVTDILLALPSVTRERRHVILESLRDCPVHVRTLPGLSDLASGRVTVNDFRELDIEDLLGREPVPPRHDLLAQELKGQVVLVSGAGGSIGSELTRQIVAQQPRQLLLLDHNEFGLYTIHHELQAICMASELTVELIPLLGSVTNPQRLHAVLEAYHPATVYHAAAYKHVPMVEDNPGEGVCNNVFGTLNLAQAAAASGARRFVLISTDKAVRPTNIMGASKRLAEMVLQALADTMPQTRFSMVRFGNVLGSSGSVVPKFRRQIRDGGPITLTHPDITRYFMTIPEAAQLVIQAGAMAKGGDVFVLDMGQPVRIKDLAERMVELSGLSLIDDDNPDGDIEIQITGLRPGEKLFEELLIGDNPKPTSHARIMKAHEEYLAWPQLALQLDVLEAALERADMATMQDLLVQLVSGYAPNDEAVDWVGLENTRQQRQQL